MPKKVIIFAVITAVLLFAVIAFLVPFFQEWKTASRTTAEDVMQSTLKKRSKEDAAQAKLSSSTQFIDAAARNKKIINILVLGLDSRKNTTTSHCDAIHMFSLDLEKKTVHITSVPRGTYTYIPPGNFPQTEYYIGNACGLAGHEYTIKQIEKLLGIKADYVIKVGFSQTLGILRLLKLPTTESLQWLRARHSFAIGDPQRSHNQAVFMKDVAVKEIGAMSSPAMLPIVKIGYSFATSDLDFALFYALVREYADSGLGQHPERIELSMKPEHDTGDYHFNFDDPRAFLSGFPIPAVVGTSTLSLDAVQNDIIGYLKRRIASPGSIRDIFDKRLWLQVENTETREDLYFKIMEKFLAETADSSEKTYLLDNYIFEKENLGQPDWAEKGRQLKSTLANNTRL